MIFDLFKIRLNSVKRNITKGSSNKFWFVLDTYKKQNHTIYLFSSLLLIRISFYK